MAKLSSLKIQSIKQSGKYGDGAGLYLRVIANKKKYWTFRYMFRGTAREMGLGSIDMVSLLEARSRALELKRLLQRGVDPLIQKKEKTNTERATELKKITFDQCAKIYIETHRISWSNNKHISQWENTLKTYASPVFGNISVQDIDTTAVLKAIEPIWGKKIDTASRLRGRIESVLSLATARGYRHGPNPASWRNHLDQILPKPSRVRAVKHHEAMPVLQMPEFMKQLKKHKGVSVLALEFLILTAARTGEVIGMKWCEIDLEKSIWIVPAERMKGKREHRVPLSARAVEILQIVKNKSDGDYVFPGARHGRPLSNMALLEILRGMNLKITSHGFRATVKMWATEYTDCPWEVSEAMLAHKLRNKVEAAYQRSDLFLKRQKLMEDWAAFISSDRIQSSSVISFKKTRKI